MGYRHGADDHSPYSGSAESKNGCSPGCIGAVGVFVVIVALLPAACGLLPLTIPGDHGPPSISVERTMSAHVVLASDHPSAVQAFTLTAKDAGRVDITAIVETPSAGVGLTVLADDGGSLAAEWDPRGGGPFNVLPSDDQASSATRRYLAVVQLTDLTRPGPTDAMVTINAHATVTGSASTAAPSFTLPSDFELSLDAVGAFRTTSVSVMRATYRETVDLAAGGSQRTLRLRLGGAATARSGGGQGHAIVGVVAESYQLPSDGRLLVHGELRPLSKMIDWDLAGSSYGRISGQWVNGADPTPRCGQSAVCLLDVVLDLDPWLYYDGQSDLASRAPVTESVTFYVEVTDFLIDAPAVPDGASVSLTLVDGPKPLAP